MSNHLPAALRTLDERQRNVGYVTLRKHEEVELLKMKENPSYNSPLSFLREPKFMNIRDRIPPFQSIIQYQILERHKRDFDQLIKNSFSNQEQYKISDKVYFGTVVSTIFNASIEPIEETDEYLVILNETLWNGLNLLSDIIAEPLDMKEREYGFNINWKIVDKNERRFKELIWRLVSAKPLYDIERKPKTEKNKMWNFFWESFHENMETFVFGHEYGHFLRRHKFNKNIPVFEKWADEFDSDGVGMDFVAMLNTNRINKNPLELIIRLCGISLFYDLLFIIDYFSKNTIAPTSSHPPAIFRFANFKRVCFDQMGQGGFAVLDKCLLSLSEIINYYVDRSAPAISSNFIDITNIKKIIEHSFQRAIFWACMENTRDRMIDYLDKLYKKFAKESNKLVHTIGRADGNIDNIKMVAPYLGWIPLSLRGMEKLLDTTIQHNILDYSDVLSMLSNGKDVYKISKASYEFAITRTSHSTEGK